MIAEPVVQIAPVELTRYRFTVAEYLRLVDIGILTEDDTVELLWGEIIEVSPINVAHASTVNRLIQLLVRKVGEQAILSVQNPLQISDESLPQPDIALLRPREDFYSVHYPGPEAVLLLVEVADSLIHYDQTAKARLYAAAGIADYWIVNLPARQIEVYREPQSDGYRMTIRYTSGGSISCLAFPDIALKVDDIIGPTTE